MSSKPLILVTNDDGVNAPGLVALQKAMQTLGRVVVVAPLRDNSAVSHSLTMDRPLRVLEMAEDVYAIDGTPTDCVTIAVEKILTEKPALVASGINPGANLGDDISYSGTVSAAIEATMLGISALAVSLAGSDVYRYEMAADFAGRVGRSILEKGLPRDTLLNVNVPEGKAADIKGIRFTRQGRRVYEGAIKETSDPWGRKHYWIGGGTPLWDEGDDTDAKVLLEGYVSITPLHLDLTNHDALACLRKQWPLGDG
ncbi:MAG: 5'/3'-nucleotidase SurE [Desulfobulbaceae bacterium]|nr:5'/3'-nucleotidase SurE [Desulfobulbaceae bacterium]